MTTGIFSAAHLVRPGIIALLLMLFPIVGCCKRSQALRTSVIRSSIGFTGTVSEVHASRLPKLLPPADNTFIVNIDTPLTDRGKEFSHQKVTVRVERSSPVKPGNIQTGKQFVFLTRPLIYADSLAVAGDVNRSRSDVLSAVQQRDDFILQDRLTMARLIVSGTVLSIRNYEPDPADQDGRKRDRDKREKRDESEKEETEQPAEWRQAIIRIDSVEKGRRPSTLAVAFPASKAFIWFRSPKFRAQQTGIWLLQVTDVEGHPAYTALYPLDFEPPDQLSRIRRLLGKRSTTTAGKDQPGKATQ